MTGHSEELKENSIIWPDASLEELKASYDEVVLRVREEMGTVKVVRCSGYIGFQLVGFWDEIIVGSATLTSDHPFLSECERMVSGMPASGSPARIKTGNLLLEVTFIDGCRLWVCGPQFRCEHSS